MPAAVPLRDVRLRPGPFLDAQRRGLETVLDLEPERLLAPFRREAGLPHAQPYTGWESDGLDGHILGHTLSALAFHAAAGSDAAAARAREIVAGLRECQAGTGYLGGVPNGRALWDELAAGDVRADSFHLNGRWVPLYNLHKVLTGLIDLVEHVGMAEADEALRALEQWWLDALDALPEGALETVLATEFGGMTTAFARLALLRRSPRLLDIARALAHRELFEPLAAGRDELDGLHANTQIPVIVGYATIARAARELGGDGDAYAAAARTFWQSVTERRSTAIGGNSVREHFHPASDFSSMFTSREGPETCNTYNIAQLAGELYLLDDDARYLAFAERAIANHLLSAQHPGHGGFVYFTPQRPGHYRVTSARRSGFWCCVGTGLEMHARHATLAFAHDGDDVRIDLPFAAETSHAGIDIAVDTAYPWADTATVTVTAAEPVERTISLRVPAGVAGLATAVLDDGVRVTASAGERLSITRRWSGTVRIDVDLPPALRVEHAPDGSAWGWIVDGPRVLAQAIADDTLDYIAPDTRMGHIARGELHPLADAPIVDANRLHEAERMPDGTVMLPAASGELLTLVPFAGLHDTRYTVSFPLAATADAAARRAELAHIDALALSLDARTRDGIDFGEQQPESDHALESDEGSTTGIDDGRRWRRTTTRIGVTMQDWSATATTLRVEWLPDAAPAAMRIEIDGVELAVVDGGAEGTVDLPLAAFTDGRTIWPLTISAADGHPTPRLRRLALLSAAADS